MRDLDATLLTELSSETSYYLANLVSIRLKPRNSISELVINLTDFHKDIEIGDVVYDALGRLVSLSQVNTSANLEVQDIKITLTGVDQLYYSTILNYEYIDRKCEIHKVFLDDQGAVIGSAIKVFEGRLNNPVINDNPNDGTSLVAITVSNYFSDFDSKPLRFTNDTQHRSRYPNDNFFSLWGKIKQEIIWGKA